MAGVLEIKAFAKINLWLHITGRRADGFHELETALLPIELADTLLLEPSNEKGIGFLCEGGGDDVPLDATNLAMRAAELFFDAISIPPCVQIRLTKRIPSGAGLGGGSSDAAAVLKGLNEWHGCPLTKGDLHRLASRLGSDVPFFLSGQPAIAKGRGDELQPFKNAPALRVLLVKPPFGVPTAWAYAAFKSMNPTILPHSTPPVWFENDLEEPVFRKYPLLRVLKMQLLRTKGVEGAAMSGSGSCLFAVLSEDVDAPSIIASLKQEFGETLFCLETRTLPA